MRHEIDAITFVDGRNTLILFSNFMVAEEGYRQYSATTAFVC